MQLNALSVKYLADVFTDIETSEMTPSSIHAEEKTLKVLRQWVFLMCRDIEVTQPVVDSTLWKVPLFRDDKVPAGYLIVMCDLPGKPSGALRPSDVEHFETFDPKADHPYGVRENRQKPFGLKVPLT